MEIKQNEEYNENGAYTKTTITKTKKEDGWQENDIMFVTEHVPHKRYFKGKSVSYNYETNDPRITRPVTIIVSVIGILISSIILILCLILKEGFLLFFGIMFLITIIMFLINSQKTINRIENDIKQDKLK